LSWCCSRPQAGRSLQMARGDDKVRRHCLFLQVNADEPATMSRARTLSQARPALDERVDHREITGTREPFAYHEYPDMHADILRRLPKSLRSKSPPKRDVADFN
jgi:hypothetical protein